MKKGFLSILLFTIGLLFHLQANAQIKGLFEKEEPGFQVNILPSSAPGTVQLVFYYTHSKIASMEASVWLRDEGTGMSSGGGSNRMVRGLQAMFNRQQDTVTISGLQDQHFYTFGVDYRSPGFITSKFESTTLLSGYRYENQANSQANKSSQPRQEVAAAPCQNPDLFVQVQPNGFCGKDNRPAVQVQCMNCEGKDWEFDVQLRTATTSWISLRADGKSQAAFGSGIRVEPLCTLEPGTYYLRVLARGANCTNTITHNVSNFVVIPDRNIPTETFQERSVSSSINPNLEKDIQTLPDTCAVSARASLQGKVIKGTLQLASNSACAAFYPYAIVNYVNPGYRDISSKPIALIPGAAIPFEIMLEDRDLNRNIQPLQIVSYAREQPNSEGIPMSAFWIKANEGAALADNSTQPTPANPTVQTYDQPQQTLPNQNTAATTPVGYDDISLTEDFQTINVKASDPNCTQIQDLNVVFFTAPQGQADRPLYVTWMNPRCCQEDGCKYTVWAGENPDRLRILVEGSKRGVFIRELLQDLLSTDTYIEVSVKTANGSRKAAYVLGEGAMYGIEALATYRDRLRPQESDAFVAQVNNTQPQLSLKGTPSTPTSMDKPMVGGDLANRAPAAFTYEKPQQDVTKYSPCKYSREILVVGDRPAVQGNQLKIQYDFSDPNYRYTLYLQPDNSTEWYIAPGTKEMQEDPNFTLNITPYHSGKYTILVHKATSSWGCLATPLDQAIEIKVNQ